METWWTWVEATFNNREIATGLWVLVALAFCLLHAKIRSSLGGVVQALLNWRLLLLFGSFAINIAILTWVLEHIELWKPDQAPATVLWYFLSGLSLLGRSLQAQEDRGHFRNLFYDSLKITVVFEFVVVAYTFSLPAELVFVPGIVFLGVLHAVASFKVEYRQGKTLLEGLLAIIVAFILWRSLSAIWQQPATFLTFANGRNFLLPLLLTVLSIPMFYLWYCYSHVEGVRRLIDFKTFQSDDLKRYARKRFFLIFLLRPRLLRRAARQFHSMPARAKEDVDKIVEEILTHERYSEYPPKVDNTRGWSPFLARDYLRADGMRTDDYHRGHDDGEWWASSPIIDLDQEILPNTVAFYLEGEEGLVRILKLKGHFMDEFNPERATERFAEIARRLVPQAMSNNATEVTVVIKAGNEFDITAGHTRASWKLERFPNKKGFNLLFTLERS